MEPAPALRPRWNRDPKPKPSSSHCKSGVAAGMQRDPIAFAVENDRPKAVRADGADRLQDFAPAPLGLADRLPDPAVHVQVNQKAAGVDRRLAADQAPAIACAVLQHVEGNSPGL